MFWTPINPILMGPIRVLAAIAEPDAILHQRSDMFELWRDFPINKKWNPIGF